MDRFKPAAPSGRGREAPNVASDRRERQIVRVLALLRVLSQGRSPSVHELAAQFRTRRETIYRDLRVLQDAGYPITGDDRGFLSRPRLLASNIPSICFTAGELDALRVAMKQVQLSLPDHKTLAGANAKLQALLDSEPHVQPFVGDYLESWTCGVKQFGDHHAHTALLVEAILRRRRCRVTYRKPASVQPKSFDFHPYRLLLVGGGLYAIGNVPKYDNIATLAINRLVSVTLDSVEFAVSPTFDPKKCRDQAFGVSWHDPQHIVLRFHPDQVPYVRERIWHPTQQFKSLPDGWLEMSFHAGGPFEIRRWILGWGDAVEVIAPASLREEVARALRSALLFYRDLGTGSGPTACTSQPSHL